MTTHFAVDVAKLFLRVSQNIPHTWYAGDILCGCFHDSGNHIVGSIDY